MKTRRVVILFLVYIAPVLSVPILPSFYTSDVCAARRDCGGETDTGKRMKCRAENLDDAFNGLVTTVLQDDTGTFTPNQKKQLNNMKERSRHESGRMEPEDFKQLVKKRKVDCYIQEILGDVEPGEDTNGNGECDGVEVCIGNEDGICDASERNKGGCAEVLNDGIGNDDGICEVKGRYKEACIEICDTDVIMAENDETNVEPGRAAEMEQSLVNATEIVDESHTEVRTFLAARSAVAVAYAICDKDTMLPCAYLKCLLDNERSSSAETIQDLVITTASLQAVADACRDVGDQTIPIPFFGGSIDVRIVCVPLGLAANGVGLIADMLEVIDDSETADRLDATALCAQDTSGQIAEVNALVEKTLELLLQPQGQREDFQNK